MTQLAIEEEHGHIVPYATLIKVWATLGVLTFVLTFISRNFHEALAVWAMRR